MTNPWIEHVRNFAKKNNMTYSCALSDKNISNGYEKKTKPSKTSKAQEPIPKKVEDTVKDFESLSMKLQQKIYLTPIDKIQKALVKLKFKGRMQTNKILLNQQLIQNFNTLEKMKSLLGALD